MRYTHVAIPLADLLAGKELTLEGDAPPSREGDAVLPCSVPISMTTPLAADELKRRGVSEDAKPRGPDRRGCSRDRDP